MPGQTISILGCGWLGFPLGKFLVQKGFSVKGSTTAPEKLQLLKENRIIPFLLNFPQTPSAQFQEFFDADILFLNVPFKRALPDAQIYRQQIQSIVSCVQNSHVKRVIFASSTSIYPETNGVVDETTGFDQANPRAVVLAGIEEMLLANKNFCTTILRFAGLFGSDRGIGSFFKKIRREKLSNAPVNLIHREDCIQIVDRIIQQDISGEIFNACCDAHPLRKDLYERFLSADCLKSVEFVPPQERSYKIVSNQKLKQMLSYRFIYPNPLDVAANQ